MFLDGWVDGWVGVKAVLRIAYSNQKTIYGSVYKKLFHKKIFKEKKVVHYILP
jgi:hypothetical protein